MLKLKPVSLFQFSDCIRKVLTAWLFAVLLEYWLLAVPLRDLSGTGGLAQMSLLRVVLITGFMFAVLLGLSHFAGTARYERWGMVLLFSLLALTALKSAFTPAFLVVCGLLAAIFVGYGIYGWDKSPEPTPQPRDEKRVWLWVTVGISAAFFLFVSIWTVARVYSFSTPTFDFGIFAQMFYNMKQSGLPMTTVERDGLLSHFAVHVSPIYYLLLPFYAVFPTPATLQVLQAAVITSAVIPLWKLGSHHGLSGPQKTLLCAALLLYPAFSGGTSYDIHENCFLTPLILWLFYGIDRKKPLITAVSALLTLLVKEDAAVYVAVIALWLLVRTLVRFKKEDKGNLLIGGVLLAVSLGWFFAVTGYLSSRGDGVMTYRYQNFIYDGSSSLLTVVKSVVMNPMKAVYECVDREKLPFIAQTMLPLLCLPLLTRRYERYILLIPYILMNLMSDYRYQHDIFFQYAFGSTAFLLYLAAVNLADLKIDWQRTAALASAAVVAVAFFASTVLPTGLSYARYATEYRDYYAGLREALDTIPDDASVAATTFYTTHLSQREILYDVHYCSQAHLLEAEFVVLRPSSVSDYQNYHTGGQENGYENLVALLEESGYRLYGSYGSSLVIYHRE